MMARLPSARFRFVAGWLGATVLCLPISAQNKSPGRAEVIQALRRSDPQGALSLAAEALRSSPQDCALLSLQGVAYNSLGQSQPALQAFQKALAFCPAYLAALEGAAQIEYAQGSPAVTQLLDRILAAQPNNPTAQAMLAATLRAEHQCEKALPHFGAARPLLASRPDLLQSYGFCLAETGDPSAALAIYQQLLAQSPDNSIRYDVALLQWKTHADDGALVTLAPLLTGTPPGFALVLASKLHEEKGETPQAVALLREAILQSPDDLDNYIDFAAIAFNHTSFQVGIDMLNAGLGRLPRAARLYVARGVLEAQISKSEAAIADFEQAHRLDPQLSFAVDAVGIMQSQQHQDKESLALFVDQAKKHADDPLLQYLLAEQLSETAVGEDRNANLAAAIAAGERAVALDVGYTAAHDLLATLYVRAKQPQRAIEQAELALAKDPLDQTALYQELMASRGSADSARINALTARLKEARSEATRRQQSTGRYSLQDAGK